METDRGTIRTMHLINAAGLWARDCALKLGLDLPLTIIEHQYGFTGPVAALAADKKGTVLPAIYDHDNSYYIRPDRRTNRIFIGAHEKPDKVAVLEEWSTKGVPENVNETSLESHFERVEDQYRAACQVLPSLAQTSLTEKNAGAFCMTPDSLPLVGPTHRLPNYWLAAGFFDGIASAGGIGKYLSDWIVEGEPPFELYETDPNRFGTWADKKFSIARSKEVYALCHNWSYKDSERLAGRPARVSGLFGALRNEGAQMRYRAGWEVAQYFSVDEEPEEGARARNYQIVTNKCGLIDLAYKGKIEVRGVDAHPFLNYALTRTAPELNSLRETLMVSPKGRIISRVNVIHHDQHRSQFMLVGEPEHEYRDIRWLESVAREGVFNVEIHNVSAFLSCIGIVGPLSIEVLSELTLADLSPKGFPFGTTRLVRLVGVPVIAVKTSETGELGFELYHNRADSLKLYEGLRKVGEKYGLTNFGSLIYNTLRLEKGVKMFGSEICLDTNPYEAGMENFVDSSKEHDFVGKSALSELRAQKFERKLALVCLEDDSSAEEANIPHGMEIVRLKGSDQIVGQITSGCFSFVLQRPLCYAWVNSTVSENESLEVDLGTHVYSAHLLSNPPSTPEHIRTNTS